jgi:hypothetical protein
MIGATKDLGITVYKPPIMPFLCKIGLHRWRLFTQALSFYDAFPEMINMISRRCNRCGKMQFTEDGGVTWRTRL